MKSAGSRTTRAGLFRDALARGFLAFAVLAGVSEAIAMGQYLASGRAYRLWTWVKVGWLYLLSFHRAGLRVSVGNPLVVVNDSPVVGAWGRSVYTIHVAFLLGTMLAGWLLFRAGKAIGARAAASGASPMLWGALVAVGYAAPISLGSLLVTLRFPNLGATVTVVRWEALAFPAIFAAAIGMIGAAARRGSVSAVGRAAAAGWRMFAVAIALSALGFVVMAGLRPDASGAYVRFMQSQGRVGWVLAGHHVLAAPNQSMAILTVAMGSCDGMYGPHAGIDMACQGRLVHPDVLASFQSYLGPRQPSALIRTGDTPASWLAFLLIPGAACIEGGRRAARGVIGQVQRILGGAAGGVVFAALVWLGSIAASLSVSVAGDTVWLGPSMPRTTILALAWGVVGGSIGAASARRYDAGGVPVPAPLEIPEPPADALPPPSPTSV